METKITREEEIDFSIEYSIEDNKIRKISEENRSTEWVNHNSIFPIMQDDGKSIRFHRIKFLIPRDDESWNCSNVNNKSEEKWKVSSCNISFSDSRRSFSIFCTLVLDGHKSEDRILRWFKSTTNISNNNSDSNIYSKDGKKIVRLNISSKKGGEMELIDNKFQTKVQRDDDEYDYGKYF